MAYLLDIAGSSILAGLFILMVLAFNVNVDSASRELYDRSMTQAEAVEAVRILDHDLYKIGYRASGQKITLADSSRVKFFSDLNNDGAIDSVYYFLGTTGEMTSTQNPNDRPVYRSQNDTTVLCMIVRDFKISYLDSAGTRLSYAALTSASERAKIKNLQVFVHFESAYSTEGNYDSFSMRKTVRPKNI